jgi:hypothetical protein
MAGRLPPLVWTQTRHGRVFDLMEPRAEDVDFSEIAETLAHLPRFGANSQKPISVAQHTLMAALAAPAEIRPYLLLHDAHEAYIGDIVTPVVRALDRDFETRRLAACDDKDEARRAVDYWRQEPCRPSALIAGLKLRLDAAIHAAAGLPVPDAPLRQEIALADRRALVTERRDFCANPPLSWGTEIEATAPLRAVFRFRPPGDVAGELLEAFRASLPALLGSRP